MQRYLVKVQNFLVEVYAEFSAEKLQEWINDKLGFVLNPRAASQPIFSTLNFQSLQDALMKISEEGAARFQGVADADAACHGQLTAVSQHIQGFAGAPGEYCADLLPTQPPIPWPGLRLPQDPFAVVPEFPCGRVLLRPRSQFGA